MKIQVCTWKVCWSKFSEYITKRIESDKEFYDIDSVVLENCMCTWNCKVWPTVYFDKELHTRANPASISKTMLEKIKWTYRKKQEKKYINNKK